MSKNNASNLLNSILAFAAAGLFFGTSFGSLGSWAEHGRQLMPQWFQFWGSYAVIFISFLGIGGYFIFQQSYRRALLAASGLIAMNLTFIMLGCATDLVDLTNSIDMPWFHRAMTIVSVWFIVYAVVAVIFPSYCRRDYRAVATTETA